MSILLSRCYVRAGLSVKKTKQKQKTIQYKKQNKTEKDPSINRRAIFTSALEEIIETWPKCYP